MTDAVLRLVVTDYTREAGVRQLERELGTLLRKTATRIASADAADAGRHRSTRLCATRSGRPKFFHEAAVRTAVPGVATGLAVTGVGGDVLFVEAASMPGKGGLVLTGQLGDVMKESARIALTYVKSHASELGIDEQRARRTGAARPRAGGRDPEGRAERGNHDGDGDCVAADAPTGQEHGRHDR